MMETFGQFLLLAYLSLWPVPDMHEPTREEITHQTEFYCAALTVYAEGRGESAYGQALIASTIRNRMESPQFGGLACDVVSAHDQFQGYENWKYPRKPWTHEPEAWMRAEAITELVFYGWFKSPCGDQVLYFYNPAVAGVLVPDKRILCRVGYHVFYGSR